MLTQGTTFRCGAHGSLARDIDKQLCKRLSNKSKKGISVQYGYGTVLYSTEVFYGFIKTPWGVGNHSRNATTLWREKLRAWAFAVNKRRGQKNPLLSGEASARPLSSRARFPPPVATATRQRISDARDHARLLPWQTPYTAKTTTCLRVRSGARTSAASSPALTLHWLARCYVAPLTALRSPPAYRPIRRCEEDYHVGGRHDRRDELQ